jgi:hypothetical protein
MKRNGEWRMANSEWKKTASSEQRTKKTANSEWRMVRDGEQ